MPNVLQSTVPSVLQSTVPIVLQSTVPSVLHSTVPSVLQSTVPHSSWSGLHRCTTNALFLTLYSVHHQCTSEFVLYIIVYTSLNMLLYNELYSTVYGTVDTYLHPNWIVQQCSKHYTTFLYFSTAWTYSTGGVQHTPILHQQYSDMHCTTILWFCSCKFHLQNWRRCTVPLLHFNAPFTTTLHRTNSCGGQNWQTEGLTGIFTVKYQNNFVELRGTWYWDIVSATNRDFSN